MKIAIVTIATRDYIEGARVLFRSLDRHGLPDSIDRLIVGPETCGFAQPISMTTDYSWLPIMDPRRREGLKNFFLLTLDYDRIISINADMLCTGDPSYLWSTRIGCLPFYASHDIAAQVYYPDNISKLMLDPMLIFNTGLYVYCRDVYPDFHEDLMKDLHDGRLETYEVGDQGYWNHFVQVHDLEIGWLPPGLNYCLDRHFPKLLPADQRIVHFCGPKPWQPLRIDDWTLPYYEMWEREQDGHD